MMPVLLAFGNLAIGDLRKLDPILIPLYSNVIILAISTVVCLTEEKGFFPTEIQDKGVGYFWLIAMVCNGFSGYICWQLKTVAYSNDRVSRVSTIMYLESAISLLFDLLVFNVHFTTMQIVGLSIIIGSFLVMIVSA